MVDNGEHGTRRWVSEAMVGLVDAVHAGNENGQHTGGFCGACAEFYVALNAVTIEHTAVHNGGTET
jgi:hypothetical protein